MTPEQTSTTFFFLLGCFVCIHAYQLKLGTFSDPGPGFIFFFGGSLLGLFSLINLCGTLLNKGKRVEAHRELWLGLDWHKNIILLVILFAYVLLFNSMGFLLSSLVLMVSLINLMEPTKWWNSIVFGFISILLCYIIFVFWLQVPFPGGILGIG